jgi:hypothetical protein
MQSNTQSIEIHAPPAKIVEFVGNLDNLPRWAVGFAKAVRRVGDDWRVTTGRGEIAIRSCVHEESGVVDFEMSFAPGRHVTAATRAIAHGTGSLYSFTQFQPPDMPDDEFARNIEAVRHELNVLRSILEVECPL